MKKKKISKPREKNKKISFSDIPEKYKQELKAFWQFEKNIYAIVLDNYIQKFQYYLKSRYKNKKIQVFSLDEFLKETMEYNTSLLISIREGNILYDPISIIQVVKINIEKGMMVGTKEILLKKFMIIKSHLNNLQHTKEQVFDNIYTSTVESAQAALISKGQTLLIPRELTYKIKKYLLNKGLEKIHLNYCSEIIQNYKNYEHKKISIPDGKKIDELAKKSEIFRDAVKKII